MFLKFTSLIFIVFTSVYSVSQNKCEMAIGSVVRYNVSMGIWKNRIQHLSSDSDQVVEVLPRLERIQERLSRILEESGAQLNSESDKTLEYLVQLGERITNTEKIIAFIQRYRSVINDFLSQYRDLLEFMNNLTDREDTTLDHMGKLRFFDKQNKRNLGGSYLSFYYEKLDWLKTTFKSTQESRKKLRSMHKELEKVEKFMNQLE